jgi:hypothetical protein
MGPAGNPPVMVVTEIVCIGLPLPKVQVSVIRGSLAQKSTIIDVALVVYVVAGVNVRLYSAWALAAEVLIVILLTVRLAALASDGNSQVTTVRIKAKK